MVSCRRRFPHIGRDSRVEAFIRARNTTIAALCPEFKDPSSMILSVR
jgi:hypothetical protein